MSTRHLQSRTWISNKSSSQKPSTTHGMQAFLSVVMCLIAPNILKKNPKNKLRDILHTIRCADWSVQVTLSIAEEILSCKLLSKVIWMEL